MAAKREYSKHRRSERMLLRIPVRVYATVDGMQVNESAEAVIISRYGALLRTTSALKLNTTIEVLNAFSQEIAKFRVVWTSEKRREGKYDIGVEIVSRREDFWGIPFPPKHGQA